jgi:hypothetical protein
MKMRIDTIVLNQDKKPQPPMKLSTAQRVSDTLRELDLTASPAEADLSDEEMNMPLPKPFYERSNKAASHTFYIQGTIERVRSEPPRSLKSDFRREQLNGDNMTNSMPNLHCSRASHNRSIGLECLDSRGDSNLTSARARTASRVAEFSLILDDL